MKIARIDTYHIPVSLWAALWDREKDLPLVTPLSMYAEHRERYGSWYWNPAMTVVVLTGADGREGLGWCEDGCRAAQVIIDEHLERFVAGASAFDHERVWDIMYRSSIPYGRKGAALEAMSAIDIAMWDLMGQVEGKPVYELLGGAADVSMRLYASALHPVDAEKVAAEARGYVETGYRDMKGRFACGPADGEAGMARNFDHARVIREAVGGEIGVALDAYMGWDVDYAIEMVKRLEPLDLAWIEEPLLPDDIKGYAKLRRASKIPISGGEHEFTRFGFEQLFDAEALDIVQPDVHRCGGFTEARKIGAMAAERGLRVICHTYSIPHLHFSVAMGCSILEHFPQPCWFEMPEAPRPLFVGEPPVAGAAVTPTRAAGLGIRLDRGRLGELMGQAG